MSRVFLGWMLKPINSRNYLPNLLRVLGLNGIGVEVGVERGEFSECLLLHSNLLLLYSVDSWTAVPPDAYIDKANVSQETHDENKHKAYECLNKFGDRSWILEETSEQASRRFENNSLDMIYLDANHRREAIKQDMELWYPKVKFGGIVAGHDYMHGHYTDCLIEVKPVVDEFVEKNRERLWVTEETWPTWFFIKAGVSGTR